MCLFGVTLLFAYAQAAAQDPSPKEFIREILDAMSKNHSRLSSIALDVEVSAYKADKQGSWELKPAEKLIQQYRRQGTLLEVDARRYVPGPQEGFTYDNFKFKATWDGNLSLSRQGGEDYARGFVSKKYENSLTILYSIKSGNVLDGFFYHNIHEGGITDVLRKNLDKISVQAAREPVAQHSCYVLKADTPCGEYTLWLDPENGYCMRKADIIIDENDLFSGKPMKESFVKKSCCSSSEEKRHYQQVHLQLEDVDIAKKDGVFMPVSGTLICQNLFDDGYEQKFKYLIERKNITFNPDFKALNAFKMDMPKDTVIYDLDVSGVKYQWDNGRMVAYVGKKAIENPDAKNEKCNLP